MHLWFLRAWVYNPRHISLVTNQMAEILDGKKLSESLALELKREISDSKTKPKLVIIQIGDHEESNTYIRNKKLFGEKIGAVVEHKRYETAVSQKEVIADIARYNADNSVHGIIVQLPVPDHLDSGEILEAIDPRKDVDGMTSKNIKLLYENREHFLPATTRGLLLLLEKYKINLAGKKVVIIGHSVLVGKPIILAMLNRKATVTVCNSQTKSLESETKTADILIVAVGQPKLITAEHVSSGQVVIDIGINIGKDKKIVGDVDFENVKNIVSAITPVPGGVGPMTIVSLFQNLLEAMRVSG